MKNFKSLFLSYTKGELCKRPLNDARNYFYDFFKKNIIEIAEITRLQELKKMLDKPEEIDLIDKKLKNLNTICLRNAHIVKETEEKIQNLQKEKIYHDVIYQAVWLKNLLKYYPNQEQYILKDYGIYVNEIAKSLISTNEDKTIYCIDNFFAFIDEYKFAINLTIKALGNLKCNLLNGLKVNHALQMGYEAYLIGDIKKEGVVTALLFDAFKYSPNAEKLQKRVKKINKDFNGEKVLNIYFKTGQKSNLQENSWIARKNHQLNILKTPGISSFSAYVILLIGQKINLYEISKLFEELKATYKLKNPDATAEMINTYLNEQKANFWNEYASITENDAKKYYSDLVYILNKIQSIPHFLLDQYEDNYLKVFGCYPIF